MKRGRSETATMTRRVCSEPVVGGKQRGNSAIGNQVRERRARRMEENKEKMEGRMANWQEGGLIVAQAATGAAADRGGCCSCNLLWIR